MQRHCKDQLQWAVIFHCPGYKSVQRGAHKHVSVVCPMWWGISGQQARPGQLLGNSGGKLALSVFLLGLLNVRTTLLMFITSQLHDGFCDPGIKPHLPTYLLQREWEQKAAVLVSENQNLSQTPSSCCLPTTVTQDWNLSFNSVLFSTCTPPPRVMCISKFVDSTSLKSHIHSSLAPSTNSAFAQTLFIPCLDLCHNHQIAHPSSTLILYSVHVATRLIFLKHTCDDASSTAHRIKSNMLSMA